MFNLTRQEKLVLIFISAVFFVGIGLSFALKYAPGLRNVYYHFETLDKLDLNKATQEQLTYVSGIGPSLAEVIIDHRNKYGPFKNLEELKQIKGIGEKKFQKIKQYLIIKNKN